MPAGSNGTRVKQKPPASPAGAAFTFDLDDLTVEDMEAIEDATGKDISTLTRGQLMRGFAYVLARRSDPSFTWEQAGKVRISTLTGDHPFGRPAAGPGGSDA